MTTSPAICSSILNIPTSKIPNPDANFTRIKFPLKKKPFFTHFSSVKSSPDSVSVLDNPSSSSAASVSNSLSLDQDNLVDDEAKKAESKIGSKVKVTVPLTVYHVPKVPEFELTGKVGVLKQYVGVHKGKKISANLPYKVEFIVDEVQGRDGKPVKFLAHLREDEFELID